MRRSPIVLAATVAGTAGVLAFHPHAPTVQTATAPPSRRRRDRHDADRDASGRRHRQAGEPATGRSGTATGDADRHAVRQRPGPRHRQGRQDRRRSRRCSCRATTRTRCRSPRSAEPILQQEALAKQTAAVDAVSGATFTSASYTQSLQSALDKLGFKAADGSVATLQVPSGGGR